MYELFYIKITIIMEMKNSPSMAVLICTMLISDTLGIMVDGLQLI